MIGKKGGSFEPQKVSVLYKQGVLFGQIVSEKGVFFTLGNADMSYLVHMSAGTGWRSDMLGSYIKEG